MTTDLLRRVQDANGPSWDLEDELASYAGGFDGENVLGVVHRDFPDATIDLVDAPHGCSARIVTGSVDVTDARLDRHLPLAIIAAWLKAKETVAETTKDTRNV